MEGSITLVSARDQQGHALLNECTLITGAGPVQFAGGVAHVTPEQAALFANRDDIHIRRENGHLEAVPDAPTSAGAPALPLALQDASPDELDFAAHAIAAKRGGGIALNMTIGELVDSIEGDTGDLSPEASLTSETPGEGDGAAQTGQAASATAESGGEASDDPPVPASTDLHVDPDVAAAQAHLRDQGEHVPKALPAGFEPTTGEGEPRCYARKADSSQCANSAKMDGEHSTYACGLERHKEQVAQLP